MRSVLLVSLLALSPLPFVAARRAELPSSKSADAANGGGVVSPSTADQEISAEEFKREYTAAVAKLEERLRNVRIVLKRDFRWEDAPHDGEYLRLGDKRASIVKLARGQAPLRGGNVGRVRVYTPDEAFVLTRPAHDRDWLITERQLRPSGEAWRITEQTTLDVFLFLPFAYAGIPLPQLLFSPTANLRSIRRVSGDVGPGSLVDVDVEVSDPVALGFQSGVFTFLPSHGWALVAFRDCKQVRAGEGHLSTNFAKLEYDLEKDYVYPVKASQWVRYAKNGDKDHKHHNLELKSIVFGNVKDEEYTLPYYGFPDFQDHKPDRKLNPYVWAAGLSVLGMVFLFLARRRNKLRPGSA